MHERSCLDRKGDDQKRALTQDARWRQMMGMQNISILPQSEFTRLQKDFNALRSCPILIKEDLQEHSECPHCGFDPRTENNEINVQEALDAVSRELERLHAAWTARLREELLKPDISQDVALLKPPYREQIQAFMSEGKLQASLSDQFIHSINDALHGLEKVVINGTELFLSLTQPGMPCTVEELNQRLDALLQKQLGDKDPDKIRIEIDW